VAQSAFDNAGMGRYTPISLQGDPGDRLAAAATESLAVEEPFTTPMAQATQSTREAASNIAR
jgi:hypothetical protein